MNLPPRMVVVIGVSGSGKSSVGAALAQACGWSFLEGDDLHPPANIAKMRAGIALTDADRQPWLDAVGAWMAARQAVGEGGVVACSALRRVYRDRLRGSVPALQLVVLETAPDLLARRMRERQHFMPPSLLESQLATWEPPGPEERAIRIDAGHDVAGIVEQLRPMLFANDRGGA
jgi:gluconokinase